MQKEETTEDKPKPEQSSDLDNHPDPDRFKRGPEITLHQLRIFWAVAHSDTLTKAAKQLGLAQPSLSQQLAKLEQTIGTRLFDRRSNQMIVTDAGSYLLGKAEHVLRGMREIEDGLGEFGGGTRGAIRIAGLSSILRVVLPTALKALHDKFPNLEFDMQENAPAEILEMLYARRAHVGLIASNSLAEAHVGFLQTPVYDDPYVLAVPSSLDLAGVDNPERELSADGFQLLNNTIQFVFASRHTRRVEDWYDHALPRHRIVAQCRSFEVALNMVRSGIGVCLIPALSAIHGGVELDGLNLYRVRASARRVVALLPSQYRRIEPYASLLEAFRAVGKNVPMPKVLETPPFLAKLATRDF